MCQRVPMFAILWRLGCVGVGGMMGASAVGAQSGYTWVKVPLADECYDKGKFSLITSANGKKRGLTAFHDFIVTQN